MGQAQRRASAAKRFHGFGIFGQTVLKLGENMLVEAIELVLNERTVSGIEAYHQIVVRIARANLTVSSAKTEGIVLSSV